MNRSLSIGFVDFISYASRNDANALPARMAGYYKGVQSAGAAVSFGMDAVRVRPSPAYSYFGH